MLYRDALKALSLITPKNATPAMPDFEHAASVLRAEGYEINKVTLFRWSKKLDESIPHNIVIELRPALERIQLKQKNEIPIISAEGLAPDAIAEPALDRQTLNELPASYLLSGKVSTNPNEKDARKISLKMTEAGLKPEASKTVNDKFDAYFSKWMKTVAKVSKPAAINLLALYRFTKSTDALHAAPAIGALLYFVSPLDLIPDYIPFVGFLDDIAVVTAVVLYLDHELKPFREQAKAEIEKNEKSNQ